jgi:predicted nucleotidyltransferase
MLSIKSFPNKMNLRNTQPTPYPEINSLITDLVQGILSVLNTDLVGIYLFGSLSYGDFNPDSSDIDLSIILQQPLLGDHLLEIKHLHQIIEEKYPRWAKRIETSYTPLEMFSSILPPKQPRPYYGEGIFYDEAHYGHEWIINNYLLREFGITLFGKEAKTLIQPIDIEEVQKACIRDLFKEWQPKISDLEWLSDGHYQSYIVLNLCRILYTIHTADALSKKVAAQWVKTQYPQWQELIQDAEHWRYGDAMNHPEETIDFIKFAIGESPKTPLYQKLSPS